jgi:hypothetical protein
MLTSPARLVPTRLLAGVVAACVFAATAVMAAEPTGTKEVTAVSILQDIGNEIHDYNKVQASTLLLLVSTVDERPVYIDHALLVLQFPKGKWMLVHALRVPKPSPVGPRWSPKWQPLIVMDSARRFNRLFDHPPTRQEVKQFLQDNEFPLESDRSDRVVERVVDGEAWQKTLGYKSDIASLTRSAPTSPANQNVGGTSDLSADAVSKRILGRWERSDGKEPMEFSKDRKCKVHFGDGMIKGTYTISADGKITVEAKTKDIRLSLHFYFEGERLTDGVVFLEEGKHYWRKASK